MSDTPHLDAYHLTFDQMQESLRQQAFDKYDEVYPDKDVTPKGTGLSSLDPGLTPEELQKLKDKDAELFFDSDLLSRAAKELGNNWADLEVSYQLTDKQRNQFIAEMKKAEVATPGNSLGLYMLGKAVQELDEEVARRRAALEPGPITG